MQGKIINGIFVVMVFCLIFCNIPKELVIGIIGGEYSHKLVFIPLLVGFFYTLFLQHTNHKILQNRNKFLKFLVIYFAVIVISLLIGLYNYPYFEAITTSPLNQIEKLPKVLEIFEGYGIINANVVIQWWMILRSIKGIFIDVFYTFCASYMIYCWYKDDWKQGVDIFCRGVLCSVVVIFIYCSIELPYLAGNMNAKTILEIITPYIHVVKVNGTWWPELLSSTQLRSVFAEAPYFGIYSAFALPVLWYLMTKDKFNSKSTYIYIIVTCIMTFLMFLAKGRTGFMLHCGELVLLFMALVYLRKKEFWKRCSIIFLCSAVAFVGSNLFISKFMNEKQAMVEDKSTGSLMLEYVDSNAASLANPDRRSNRARYSIMKADLRIGLDHPLFGVGRGLRNAYIPDYLDEKALANREIKMWISFSEKLGILKFIFPKLGEYTSRFAETGLLGLLVFLVPPIVLILAFLKKIKQVGDNEKLCYVMMLISLLGIMASGIGDTINITYCYWVLLGLGYAMCFGKEKEIELNERT